MMIEFPDDLCALTENHSYKLQPKKLSSPKTRSFQPQTHATMALDSADCSVKVSDSDKKQADVVARRCMETFVEEMKEFRREGGFKVFSEKDRTALNDLMVERFLEKDLAHLPNTPVVCKVREIISNFINGKCRSLEVFIDDQMKNESRDVTTDTTWKCAVCGKQRVEVLKKGTVCSVCGHSQDQSQMLNSYNIDIMPHTAAATKDELSRANYIESKRKRWLGDEGQRLVLLSKKADYEALEREDIKSEIHNVLASIRLSIDES